MLSGNRENCTNESVLFEVQTSARDALAQCHRLVRPSISMFQFKHMEITAKTLSLTSNIILRKLKRSYRQWKGLLGKRIGK